MDHQRVSALLDGVTLRLAETRKAIAATRTELDDLPRRISVERLGHMRQPRDLRRLPIW